MIDSIYALQPINKTAAVVTGQSGCSTDLSAEQKRSALVSRVKQIQAILADCKLTKASPEKKSLIAEQAALNQEISLLNKEIKKKPRSRDISPFFLLAAKSELTKLHYERIFNKAKELGIKYDWDTDKMKMEMEKESR